MGTGGMNLVPLTATRQTTESVSGKRQIKKKNLICLKNNTITRKLWVYIWRDHFTLPVLAMKRNLFQLKILADFFFSLVGILKFYSHAFLKEEKLLYKHDLFLILSRG